MSKLQNESRSVVVRGVGDQMRLRQSTIFVGGNEEKGIERRDDQSRLEQGCQDVRGNCLTRLS